MLPAELQDSINKGLISHAYLFLNREIALEFAKALTPKAVDFFVLKPSSGKVHILTDDVEKLQEELKFKPYGDRRVVFIDGADAMMEGPQNKLLKTLEEPPNETVIILYSQRRDALLPTVLSRCVEISCPDSIAKISDEFMALAKTFYDKKKAGAEFFELKNLLIGITEDKNGGREKALQFLDALENILRDDLLTSLDSGRLKKAIILTEETRKNIKSSFSVSYALKALALNI